MRRRVRAAARLRSFVPAQARKLSLPRPLGWAEGLLTRRARKSDGDAAFYRRLERILRVLCVDRWARQKGLRLIELELVEKIGLDSDSHDYLFFF